MSNQTASAPATKTDQIYKTVARQVVKIQHGYIKRTSSAVAELAALRNCPLDRPGRDPQVWALTLADLPPNLQGKGDAASFAESAVHGAIALYGHHQASLESGVHRPNVPFASAVRDTASYRAHDRDLDENTLKRLKSVLLATGHSARMRHLLTLVRLMRSVDGGVGFDYGLLARDLYLLQFGTSSDGVRLRWGRELHAIRPESETAESINQGESA